MKLSDWADIATIIATAVGIIGACVAIKTYRKDRQDNRHNNELTGMPDFYFTGPNECERFGVSFCHSDGPLVPKLAITCRAQEMVYWFNLINCGKFAAKDVRIAIISQSEYNNIASIPKDRWKSIRYWSGMPSSSGSSFNSTDGDLVPIYTTIGDLEIRSNDQELYVLLEYTSSYSKIRYKRLYKWCISSERTTKDKKSRDYIFAPIIDRSYDFGEDDMAKNDFDSAAYSKIEEEFKTKDSNGKISINIDEQTRAEEEFYRTNLTLEQTQLKQSFKRMRLGRPVFLKDVQLQSATNSSEIKPSKSLRKQSAFSAEDWLELY